MDDAGYVRLLIAMDEQERAETAREALQGPFKTNHVNRYRDCLGHSGKMVVRAHSYTEDGGAITLKIRHSLKEHENACRADLSCCRM